MLVSTGICSHCSRGYAIRGSAESISQVLCHGQNSSPLEAHVVSRVLPSLPMCFHLVGGIPSALRACVMRSKHYTFQLYCNEQGERWVGKRRSPRSRHRSAGSSNRLRSCLIAHSVTTRRAAKSACIIPFLSFPSFPSNCFSSENLFSHCPLHSRSSIRYFPTSCALYSLFS